jgi:hypothetical protein
MKIAFVAFVRFAQRLYSLVWPTATKSSLLQNLDEFRNTPQKSRPHGKSCPYLDRRIEWFRRRGEWMLVILCRFCRCECTSMLRRSPICLFFNNFNTKGCWDLMRCLRALYFCRRSIVTWQQLALCTDVQHAWQRQHTIGITFAVRTDDLV